MLEILDQDPWGRPYCAIRAKFAKGPPVVDCLDPQFLDSIVETLFPERIEHIPPIMRSRRIVASEPEASIPTISDSELEDALCKLQAKNKAPGPDEIPSRVLALSVEYLGSQLRNLYDECLVSGISPGAKKVGRLVLLQKPGKPLNTPSGNIPPNCPFERSGQAFGAHHSQPHYQSLDPYRT
jgi:hypothetical protein